MSSVLITILYQFLRMVQSKMKLNTNSCPKLSEMGIHYNSPNSYRYDRRKYSDWKILRYFSISVYLSHSDSIQNQNCTKQTICPKWSRVGIHYDSPNSAGEQLERCPTGYYTSDPRRGGKPCGYTTILHRLVICLWYTQTITKCYFTGDPCQEGTVFLLHYDVM